MGARAESSGGAARTGRGRFSARRKTEAVLRILRFEPVRYREERDESRQADAQLLARLMQKPTLSYFEARQALALSM